MPDYSKRIERLQSVMKAQVADIAVFSFSDQMRYLTGYAEDGHKRFLALFVPSIGDPIFLVPAMNAPQARSNPAGIASVVGWEDSAGWHREARELFDTLNAGGSHSTLIDDELFAVHLIGLQRLFPEMRFLPAEETMAILRSIKTNEEISSLKNAAELIDDVYEDSINHIREGMTETELKDIIETSIRKHGSSPSFMPLICFGMNGAMPHHSADATRLKRGDTIVIDIGCTWDNYCSDITRTVSFGQPGDSAAPHIYDIVYRAHKAAQASAHTGVSCSEVDAAARNLISEEGYGEFFIHRLGHGIGLSGHEPPYLHSANASILQTGMCFSIEPGIYLPGRFGIRIENIVQMTDSGAASLNAEPSSSLIVLQ